MRKNLTLGSLFDGSGGFPLGGLLAGITPVWASEIEPFPIRVTTKRLPFMKHYGDVSTMDGAKLEPVDIITFGSPCQDMSIAGRRSGLDGDRSSLFYEAIRIIKEMRCATNGKYPRWICWENVPGAFSSNGGFDFKAVLEAVISIVEDGVEVPMPEKNKWPYADLYVGDGWSIAYRVFDAQWFGLAQRRKRIFLVADLADRSAGKVLFESEGLSGYSAEGFAAWQRASRYSEDCPGTTGHDGHNGIVLNDQGGNRMDITDDVTCTLRAESHHPPCVLESPAYIPLEHHPLDCRIKIESGDAIQTLTHRMGTGGNNVPLVMANQSMPRAYGIGSDKSEGMLSKNPLVGFYEAETARTLDRGGGNPSCNQGGIAVVEECPVYAMTTGYYTQVTEEKAPTLLSRDYKDAAIVNAPCYGIGRDTMNQGATAQFTPTFVEELQPTLVAKGPGGAVIGYLVRRLTPTECARLQGFPDWWCSNLGEENPSEAVIEHWSAVFETYRKVVEPGKKPKTRKQIIKWLKDPHSDAAEYKMWGNGVALSCVYFVLSGIVWVGKCGEK